MAKEGGRRHDYIPSNNAQFNDWFKNLVAYVQSKTTRGTDDANGTNDVASATSGARYSIP